MNLGWFGVPPSGGSNGLDRLKPGLQAVSGFMVPMHANDERKLSMMTLQRVLLFAVVCLCFTTEFDAGSAESPNDRRLAALEKLVRDDSPRVRLEALRALAKIPSAKSAELALNVLDKPMDPFLDYALWLTINDLDDPWIAAIKSGEWKVEGHEKQLDFGLKAIEPEKASLVLGQLLGDQPLS